MCKSFFLRTSWIYSDYEMFASSLQDCFCIILCASFSWLVFILRFLLQLVIEMFLIFHSYFIDRTINNISHNSGHCKSNCDGINQPSFIKDNFKYQLSRNLFLCKLGLQSGSVFRIFLKEVNTNSLECRVRTYFK